MAGKPLMKKGSVSSSTLINEVSYLARPKSSRSKAVNIETVLEKLSVHDQSEADNNSRGDESRSRENSLRKGRGLGQSTASTVSPANTIVPKVAARSLKGRDEGEVHEEDVSEILSDFEGEEEGEEGESVRSKARNGGFEIDEVFGESDGEEGEEEGEEEEEEGSDGEGEDGTSSGR